MAKWRYHESAGDGKRAEWGQRAIGRPAVLGATFVMECIYLGLRLAKRLGHLSPAVRAIGRRSIDRSALRGRPSGFLPAFRLSRKPKRVLRSNESAAVPVGRRVHSMKRTIGSAGLFAAALAVVIFGGSAPAWAQRPARPPATPPAGPAAGAPVAPAPMVLVPMEVSAPVSAVQQGMIIVHDGQQPFSLRLGERTEIHIRGKVEPDMLKPGAAVRFFAEIDKRRGRVRGKIDQITLFTPAKDGNRMLGAFYHQPSAVEGAEGAGAPPAGAASPPDDGKNAEAGRTNRLGKTEEQYELFDVRGQVVGLRGAILTVNVQTNYFRSPIRAEISEGCTIIADLADINVIRPGDQVQGRGVQIMPQALEMLSLEVTLAESLTSLPRKKPRPQTAKTPPRTTPARPDQPRDSFEVADQIAKERAAKDKTATTDGAMGPSAGNGPGIPDQGGAAPNAPPGQSAPGDERPPMAETEPRRNGAEPPGSAEPPAGSSSPSGETPKRSAEELAQLAEKLVGLLGTSRQEQILRGGFKARLADGKETVFLPAKRLPADDLRRQVGQPDSAHQIAAELPVGEDGALQKVQWSIWAYGPLRVLVDDRGRTQYFGVQASEEQAKPASE